MLHQSSMKTVIKVISSHQTRQYYPLLHMYKFKTSAWKLRLSFSYQTKD